jgi:hypothetical protein
MLITGLTTKAERKTTGRKSMKRREFLKVTGIGAAGAATLAAPAIAQSMPEIKWHDDELAKVARYDPWRPR